MLGTLGLELGVARRQVSVMVKVRHAPAIDARFAGVKIPAQPVGALAWTQHKTKHSGEFVRFDEMMQWPKPVQKPPSELAPVSP